MNKKVRTRFAPSPTGYLHIGGLRTALYAYLFAKKHDGTFILRIEDTDQERLVPGAVEIITGTLRETGLYYDEGPGVGGAYGPYVQTERRAIYQKCAKEIVERGGAYVCFCPKERLDELRAECEARGETFKYDKRCLGLPKEEVKARVEAGEPHVIRQNIPLSGQTSFDDLLFGRITVDNATLDDAVLVKSDGLPTYNFANVVDDHMMDITHVLRGTEYLSSSPKYNLIYESMGWEIPVYIHLPPVMKTASRKLSKRDGDASFDDFVQKGYLPEAILNYIALLGWNPGTNQEKFTLLELVEAFSVDGLNKAPAIFDIAKLTWLNGEYVRALSPGEFTAYARPYYEKAGCGGYDEDILRRILQPRVEYFAQIPDMLDFLPSRLDYSIELFENKKMKTTPGNSLEALGLALPVLRALGDFTEAALHDALLGLAAERGLKNGRILWPVRVAVSGKPVSPGGAIEACALLGREETIARVERAMEKLG